MAGADPMIARMDAGHRLATYGSLAPGRPNHHHVAGLRGRWSPGEVRGRLVEAGWGSALGYPAMVLDPDGSPIDVHVLGSAELPAHWADLDELEGPGYARVLSTVRAGTGDVEAYLYVVTPLDGASTAQPGGRTGQPRLRMRSTRGSSAPRAAVFR